MDKVKVAVIGVGHLGRFHAQLYREVPDAELIGIFDVDQKKKREFAAELGVTGFDTLEQLMDEADAVNIVTPTTTHAEIAREALEKGKHVFVEKPISDSLQDGEDLVRLAEEKNLVLQVGHIERFNAALRVLEDVPLQPLFIEAHRLASFNLRGTDVSVIYDLMIHDLDLILSLVNSEPQDILASGVNVISKSIDIANARIVFRNGCVANLTASRISAKKMRKMRLFQKDAYISMDFNDGLSEIFYLSDEKETPFHDGTLAVSLGQIQSGDRQRDIKYNRLQRKNVNPLKDELIAFVDSVRNQLPPVVSGRDGLRALKLAQQVMERVVAHQELVKNQNSLA